MVRRVLVLALLPLAACAEGGADSVPAMSGFTHLDATTDAAVDEVAPIVAQSFVATSTTLSGAPLGASYTGGHDLNGDGYDDVVVLDATTPAALVYYGSSTGVSSSATSKSLSSMVTSAGPDRVASVGDVDGDGYGDLVVAASSGAAGRGILYLCRGGSAGLGACASFSTGSNIFTNLGRELAAAGDLNGDGRADIVASTGSGGIRVYRGLATPTMQSTWTLTGHSATGGSLSAAGDVNGDGYGDIAVGLWSRDSYEGGLGVIYGGPTGATSSVEIDYPWPGTSTQFCGTGGSMGYAVASAGDYNGDGYDDIVAGAPGDLRGCGGMTYVWLGSAAGINTSSWVQNIGDPNSHVWLGASLAGGSDFNGDGYGDFATAGGTGVVSYLNGFVSPPLSSASSESPYGVSGLTTSYDSVQDRSTTTAAGDVNGDGYDDVVVYKQTADGSGWTFAVYYGAP